jgi:hypothetical protein
MADSTIEIEVAADVSATADDLAAVKEAFRRVGFDVRPEPVVEGRAEAMPWVLYVTIGAPIATFFTTIAAKAGDDAYEAVKRWVKDLWAARRGPNDRTGSVVLRDTRGNQLVLSSTFPDEALDALRDIDWTGVEGDYLLWSSKSGRWLDPMKHPSEF